MKHTPKIGDIVTCTYDFAEERKVHGHQYPKKGDILTVCKRVFYERGGKYLLYFDELKIAIPLSEDCFDVVQEEGEGDMILNEAYKIANGL